MADVSDETLLARAIGDILVTAGLGVWRKDGSPYPAGEHAIVVDQAMPTTVDTFTLVTPFERVRAGRTEVIYRLQLATRLVSKTHSKVLLRARAENIAAQFDHREYTPPILGISFASEYSRKFFDADTQNRVMVTQSFQFRGHTPSPIPGTTP